MATTHKHHHEQPLRSPRERQVDEEYLWKGIRTLDLSKVKESSWLIDFFLAEASTQLIYGEFGTSKTTLLLKAAWSVSQGIDFLGMKTKRRAVLYLDYENPADVLKRYCLPLGINPSSPWFRIWDRAAGEAVPLPGSEPLKRFIRHCKKATGHCPWMIFDSWTSLLKGDENQGHNVTKVFREIRAMCDVGATNTIIDHTPKGRGNSKTAVGSIAKMTQMDTSHSVAAVEPGPAYFPNIPTHNVYRVESFLKRYAPKDVGTFSFEVTGALNEKGDWRLRSLELTADRGELKKQGVVERVKQLIRHNPTLGKKEIAKKVAELAVKNLGRNASVKLLEDGIAAKAWETITRGKSHKQVFRLLKATK